MSSHITSKNGKAHIRLRLAICYLFSFVVMYFVTATHYSVYAVDSFSDNFDRSDGALDNNWSASSWTISGGKVINTPVLSSEIFTNSGAEGVYSSGLAPNWTKIGTDLTVSEERTNIHGGSSAQKVIGGTTTSIGVRPTLVSITSGNWYLFNGWIRNDGPGNINVRRCNARLANITKGITATGAYERMYMMDLATSTGTESLCAYQQGTTAQTFYLDDFSLRQLTYSSLFAGRSYNSTDVISGATVTYVGYGRAGVFVSLDSLSNPQSYVVAYYDGAYLKLSKVINQSETNLINQSMAGLSGGWTDGELVEIRKNGTTYQMFYRGKQIGTDQVVSDNEIVNNTIVGLYDNAGSTFDSFAVRAYTDQYPVPDYSAFGTYTYGANKGVLSLRFDDGVTKDLSYVYPLLTARNLVAGFAVVRSTLNLTGKLTLAEALTLQSGGMEIMDHSLTHQADPASQAEFLNETVTAAEEMRRLGFTIWSWVQPGVWVADYNFDSTDDYGTAAETVLRQYFKSYEAYIVPYDTSVFYNMPRSSVWGVRHLTGDTVSLATLETRLDTAIANKQGMEVLFHSNNIGTVDNISEADFESFLDYIQAKVNTGTLKVFTPTQQLFAQPVTLTIDQATGQSDPTSGSIINFAVTFSHSVTGFDSNDISLSGTAGATTATVTGSGAQYNVAVSGMTQNGTVIISIGANAATDSNGSTSASATNTDNTVNYSVASPSNTSVSSQTKSVSSTSAPGCNDQVPGTRAPWLYGAIPQSSESVLLYFTEAESPITKYVMEYGLKPGEYQYGVQDMGLNSQSQMTFLVQSLTPNTAYYFRIRGQNGCATGNWSNEISATTKGPVSLNQLEIIQSSLEPIKKVQTCQSYTVKPHDTLWSIADYIFGQGSRYSEIIEQNVEKYPSLSTSNNISKGWELKINCNSETEKTQKSNFQENSTGYVLSVKVLDTNQNPIKGAKVTIHSKIQEVTTDKDGIARFQNVEPGDHKINITYANYEGEQSINLAGDVKEFSLSINVQPMPLSLSPLAYIIIGGLVLIIIGMVIFPKRK